MSCHPEPKLPQVTTTKLHLHWPVNSLKSLPHYDMAPM